MAISRGKLNRICNKSMFNEEITAEEEGIYCQFHDFVMADLRRQLKETGDYKAPDDFYEAFIQEGQG